MRKFNLALGMVCVFCIAGGASAQQSKYLGKVEPDQSGEVVAPPKPTQILADEFLANNSDLRNHEFWLKDKTKQDPSSDEPMLLQIIGSGNDAGNNASPSSDLPVRTAVIGIDKHKEGYHEGFFLTGSNTKKSHVAGIVVSYELIDTGWALFSDNISRREHTLALSSSAPVSYIHYKTISKDVLEDEIESISVLGDYELSDEDKKYPFVLREFCVNNDTILRFKVTSPDAAVEKISVYEKIKC